jgi:hypothetical protein
MAPPLTGKNLIRCLDFEGNAMKKLRLHVRAYLAALLFLAAFPAEAADVKELFATDLADYPGKSQ